MLDAVIGSSGKFLSARKFKPSMAFYMEEEGGRAAWLYNNVVLVFVQNL